MKNLRTNPILSMYNLIDIFSRLAAACEEDAKRFERAAREVSNEELSLLFSRYARRRAEFAIEVRGHIDQLEERPVPSGVIRVHRRTAPRPVAKRRDDATILCDREQAEGALLAIYNEALRRELPAEIQRSLRRQYLAVSDVHDQLRNLCAALAWCAVPMAV